MKDHPGRVRGFGGEVRQKHVFPKAARQTLGVADFEALVDKKLASQAEAYEDKLRKAMEVISQQSQQRQVDPPRPSSSSSCAAAPDPYPFANLKVGSFFNVTLLR